MNIKPLIDAVEILEEAKLATFDEKDRLEIGLAIFKVRCVLQKHGVFLGGAEKKPEPEPKPPFSFKPTAEIQAMWDKANEAIAKVVRENNLRIDQLTEAQCTQAIIQAFQCGDFKRLVRASDNAQQVIYTPFAECEALRSLTKELGETLGNVQDALDSYWREQPDTVSAVQAVVADANKFRIQLSKARQALLECNRDDLASVREALKD